jgi:hypothetical protein
MRLAILIILCFLAYFPAVGQQPLPQQELPSHLRSRPQLSLSGLWTGELLQNEGGIADRFGFTMHLRQNGIFMTGTAHVQLGEIWAEMKLSGFQLANGSWQLTETEIIRSQKPDDLSWCMKRYELRVGYTAKGMTLHGPWWGSSKFGPCVPGSVRLKIMKKTA